MQKMMGKLIMGAVMLFLLVPITVKAENDQGGTAQVSAETEKSGTWIKSGNRWWYQHADGSYTKGDWERIDGLWYYFDGSGWMLTGWQKLGNFWYYLSSSGHMLTGWQQVNGTWYYMDEGGAMAADTWIDGYYVNASGAWVVGKEMPKAAWVNSGGRWWYRHADGSYTTSDWEQIDGRWYYFDASGWMLTGWLQEDSKWYYLSPSGHMLTGWQWVGNYCYFLDASGVMAADTWVGPYYVDAGGAWVPERYKGIWIQSDGRWWYRHEDGSYTKSGWEEIDGTEYYFDASGWMVTGWLKLGGEWYYLKPNGSKAYDYWVGTAGVGGYYVSKYGTMVAGETYSLGDWIYSFDENGLCTGYEYRYVFFVDPRNGREYKLEKQFTTDPQVGVDVTEDEFLACAVFTEAGNQGLPGMTGVAMVMLNRMNNPTYPSSANFLIYQAGQFEVARNGTLTYWLRNKDSAVLNNAKAAVTAAREIMYNYLTYGTPRVVEGLTMPEGKTDFDYEGFMTPKSFEKNGLDWEKTEAFTYLNTTFYTTWIKKTE